MLSVDFSTMGIHKAFIDQIHPVIIEDKTHTILVDCGYQGSLKLLEEAMMREKIDPSRLTHILITHHDHMGALATMKQQYPHILIVASSMEASYISGQKTSPRLIQAEKIQQLPQVQKKFGESFCALLRSIEPVPVDIIINDSQILDWGMGCEILSTLGHTPGHCSLWFAHSKVLITGDAATIHNHRLVLLHPKYALDPMQATTSLHRICALPAEQIICYHGGIFIPECDQTVNDSTLLAVLS